MIELLQSQPGHPSRLQPHLSAPGQIPAGFLEPSGSPAEDMTNITTE